MAEVPSNSSKLDRFQMYSKIKEEAEQWTTMDGRSVNFDHPNFMEAKGARDLVIEIKRVQTDNFIKDEEAVGIMRQLRNELWSSCNGGI